MRRQIIILNLATCIVAVAGCNDAPVSQTEDARDGATIDQTDAEDDLTDADDPTDAVTDITDEDTASRDVAADSTESDTSPGDATSDGATADTIRDVPPDAPPTDAPTADTPSTDGGVPTWRVCTQSSDCTLAKNNCCGWCGTPTLSDLDPVHKNRISDHQDDVCNDPNPICPACAQSPIPDGLQANCQAGVCQELDLQPFQSCTRDDQCRVRTLDCCEDCQADTSSEALVAINRNDASQVQQALCPTPNPACANCPIQYPTNVTATCNSNGRCVLN